MAFLSGLLVLNGPKAEAMSTHTDVNPPNVTLAVARVAEVGLWLNTIRWNDTVVWNAAVKRAETAAHPVGVPQATGRSTRQVAVSAPSSNHDPCAEPINGMLPAAIVSRESGGQCGAYNHNGCSGRGCLGWAQIDEGHFSADSPWGPGPGTCYRLSYNACVAELSDGGSNLAPWGG